jgi:hypothetical protein
MGDSFVIKEQLAGVCSVLSSLLNLTLDPNLPSQVLQETIREALTKHLKERDAVNHEKARLEEDKQRFN